ncbi:MAG: bifunctional nuclease family protein [Cyclobacteriaceae bacterium]|jgi:bifunctional DNase/RNase|nr:bifunctional nuclease family protein [Cytophagales bacterium]MCZ8326753.1 bifunctional nuclease family protein [Cyclobacteriaceae bacterium]
MQHDKNGMMQKKELIVVGLSASASQDGKNYSLILQDTTSERKIPILIGVNEGQSIALVMEKLKTNRPITHELFRNTLEALGATLQEVLIKDIDNGIFYASIFVVNETKQKIEIDARPSDAIALAVRFGCPIFTYEFVINEAAVIEDSGKLNLKRGSFAEYTLEELEELLASILAKEDYESAARVRDVIERRKSVG